MSYQAEITEVKKNLRYYSLYLSYNTDLDVDDAEQELMIRLWKAKARYKDKLSSIKTYYINCIKQQVRKMIQDNRNTKRTFHRDMIRFDAKIKNENGEMEILDTIPTEDCIMKQIEDKDILDNIERNIKDTKTKQVFMLLRHGADLEEMAGVFQMTKQGVCQIISRKIRPIAREVVEDLIKI